MRVSSIIKSISEGSFVPKLVNRFAAYADDLLIQKSKNLQFKTHSPYYQNLLSTDCFRDNCRTSQIDEAIYKDNILRISKAYKKAKLEQKHLSSPWQIGAHWSKLIDDYYSPLQAALAEAESGSIMKLEKLFSNFGRGQFSRGLTAGSDFEDACKNGYPIRAINEYLCDLHSWINFVGSGSLAELDFPHIGNPYGPVIDNKLLPGSVFRHNYYSKRIKHLLKEIDSKTVLEIGGGFGGMAYQLLKNESKVSMRYYNFDLPEVLAISSYFLMTAFPEKKFLLFGEADIQLDCLQKEFDCILMPNFELPKLNENSVDLVFNSVSLMEMDLATIDEYLIQSGRISKHFFLHVNHDRFDSDDEVNITTSFARLTGSKIDRTSFRREYALADLFLPSYYECLYKR